MNFITLSFAFFFLFVLAMGVFFRKGTFTYKLFLLGFNLFFYAFAGFAFIPLLLFVGGLNWLSAKLTFHTSADISDKAQRTRKNIIGINIFIHVCLLVFYKYYEFLLLNMELGFNYWGIPIPLFDLISTTNLIFPIGLSFYTFQGLSYAIDQYRNPQQESESLFNVLLFVSFFPTILAGPILRGHEFFVQLKGDIGKNEKDEKNEKKNSHIAAKELQDEKENSHIAAKELQDEKENSQVTEKDEKENSHIAERKEKENSHIADKKEDILIGFSFILSGLFKKLVLASYLSEHIVRDVFLAPDLYSSTTVLIAVYAYAMQIYCDFSGYSDLAVGIGRLMGYKLPQNFNAPYLACSLQDFWRRWHITLSLWLRDYLYIPLGGNKKGNKSLNLIITMTLGGLWHGSYLRFLIWGFMHGIGLSFVHLWHYLFRLLHKQKGNSLDSNNQPQIKEIEPIPQIKEIEPIPQLKNGVKNPVGSQIKNLVVYQIEYQTETPPEHLAEYKIEYSEENQSGLLVLKPLVSKLVREPTIFARMFKNIRMLMGWFITFHFVTFLWIFFRAEDTQIALDIIKHIIAFNLPGEGFPVLVLVAIFITMFLQFFGPYIFRFFVSFLKKLWSPMQILLIAIACAIILKLGPDGVLPFIYFQF